MQGEKRFVYRGAKLPDPGIDPVPYDPSFFQLELHLESELFFEPRKRSGITPHRIDQSGPKELEGIRAFFDQHRDTFFFLFDQQELIGSILFVGNYIQSLGVAKAYQRKGHGTKLSTFAINRILERGYDCVELNTLPGNDAAERLYRKLNFTEV